MIDDHARRTRSAGVMEVSMRPMTIIVPALVVIALLALTTLPSGYAQPTVGITAQYLPAVFKDGVPPIPTLLPSATPSITHTSTLTPSVTRTPSLTSTHTATASPTMTPVPVTLLRNGDLEQGETGWNISGSRVIVQ